MSPQVFTFTLYKKLFLESGLQFQVDAFKGWKSREISFFSLSILLRDDFLFCFGESSRNGLFVLVYCLQGETRDNDNLSGVSLHTEGTIL